ncbi:unnamed protein product [Mytilus coruscus]|uniref:Uncharacterized protein n=1 Tax=Mytilus coruscus TaxID=42192 RepID=A0A6J8BE00_MYTCO|nr:unnamed protein product [Mytilus coruscus]
MERDDLHDNMEENFDENNNNSEMLDRMTFKTRDSSQGLPYNKLADGRAETYALSTNKMISDVNYVVCNSNPDSNIMSKIKNIMTDRSATEEKTNRILMENCNNETINSFKCSVHPLIQFWDVCEKKVKEIEKVENIKVRDSDNNRKDTYTSILLNSVSKLFIKMGQETQPCQMYT